MSEQEKKERAKEQQGNSHDVDEEVSEWLSQGIAILCDADDSDVHVKFIKGERSVTFLAELKKDRHRAMLIGKQGHTINAFRQILKSMGGAFKRHYDLNLADDRPPPVRRSGDRPPSGRSCPPE